MIERHRWLTSVLLIPLIGLVFFALLRPTQATIIAQRPRLLLNDTVDSQRTLLDVIRAKARSKSFTYTRFKAYVDSFRFDGPGCPDVPTQCGLTSGGSNSVQMAAMNALMYQILKDDDPAAAQAYGVRAIRMSIAGMMYLDPAMAVVNATNEKSATFITAVPHGLTERDSVALRGGTGSWSAVNTPVVPCYTACQYKIRSVPTPTSFTVDVDTSNLGPLQAQNLIAIVNPSSRLYWSNQWRWTIHQFALAYDWAYPLLSPEDKALMVEWLGFGMEWNSRPENYYGLGSQEAFAGNVAISQIRTAAYVAAALQGDHPESPAAMNRIVATLKDTVVPMMRDGVGKGGALTEGIQYGPESLSLLLELLEVVRASTGEDLYLLAPDFARDAVQYTLLSTSPARVGPGGDVSKETSALEKQVVYESREPMPSGDAETAYVGVFHSGYRRAMLLLQHALRRAGSNDWAEYAQFWNQRMFPGYRPQGGNPGVFWLNEIIYFDPTASERDYRSQLSTDYLAAGMGNVLARSDWGEDATWVGFNCGFQGRDHIHSDCNSFQIWRKGRWLTREVPGYYSVWIQSQYHNTVRLDNLDSFRWAGVRGTAQGPGRISRFESDNSSGYMYAQGDATSLFRYSNNPATDTAQRDFFYLKPDYIFIHDRIRYNRKSTTSWFLQTLCPSQPAVPRDTTPCPAEEQPALDQNRFTLANGSQRLWGTWVQPTDASIKGIDQSAENKYLGGFRLEFEAPHTNSINSLMVLEAGDEGRAPIEVNPLQSEGVTAVKYGGHVVAFVHDEVPHGDGAVRRYLLPYQETLTHHLIGLSAGKPYRMEFKDGWVNVADGADGDPVASPAGVFNFQTQP